MTSISKYRYFNKLVDIVNKYNNASHITIKIEPIDIKSNTYINCSKEINDKITTLKIGDIVRILNIKVFFLKIILQIGLKKFSRSKKLKSLCRGYVINDLKGK